MTTIDDIRIGGVDGRRWIEVTASGNEGSETVGDAGEPATPAPHAGTLRLDLDQARYLHARLAELISHLEQD